MNPTAEYRKRLAERLAVRDGCWTRMKSIGFVRLAMVLSFLGMLWLAFVVRAFSFWFAVIPALLFIGLAIYHDRLRREFDRTNRAAKFYERGLDRLENRWQGKGNPGSEYLKEGHLYAVDLDILGPASLFELLCTAKTRSGEETLARWLSSPASREEILKRQEAVRELRDDIDLREDLALIGSELRDEVHPEFMTSWANDPVALHSRNVRITAAALVAMLLLSVVLDALIGQRTWPVFIILGAEIALALVYRSRVRAVLETIDEPARELHILGAALRRMEKEKYASQRLRQLQESLSTGKKRPSEEIATLMKLVTYLNQRRNEFFLIISTPLLWATQFTFAIEAWRRRCGPEIGSWFANFGEFEALCALAGYAYEHPEDPFPEIAEGVTVLEGDDLRHPLIPASVCVPNSVQLAGELQLLLVSGSNMSGKSTLLRTVGINAVLAQAGGPVRAKRMKLCVLAIGATLRVQDSLQAGVSRFYAEIQRLHDIMELTSDPLPVLFLLDEILHGTNSHDRAIGAEAIIRGLIESGAIGLVTTHDLALTRVAEALAPRAKNIHFQDHLENGRMTFDYVLHPGVVQKSNALELMRAVGLKV
jgi:hypothetical protein